MVHIIWSTGRVAIYHGVQWRLGPPRGFFGFSAAQAYTFSGPLHVTDIRDWERRRIWCIPYIVYIYDTYLYYRPTLRHFGMLPDVRPAAWAVKQATQQAWRKSAVGRMAR